MHHHHNSGDVGLGGATEIGVEITYRQLPFPVTGCGPFGFAFRTPGIILDVLPFVDVSVRFGSDEADVRVTLCSVFHTAVTFQRVECEGDTSAVAHRNGRGVTAYLCGECQTHSRCHYQAKEFQLFHDISNDLTA